MRPQEVRARESPYLLRLGGVRCVQELMDLLFTQLLRRLQNTFISDTQEFCEYMLKSGLGSVQLSQHQLIARNSSNRKRSLQSLEIKPVIKCTDVHQEFICMVFQHRISGKLYLPRDNIRVSKLL